MRTFDKNNLFKMNIRAQTIATSFNLKFNLNENWHIFIRWLPRKQWTNEKTTNLPFPRWFMCNFNKLLAFHHFYPMFIRSILITPINSNQSFGFHTWTSHYLMMFDLHSTNLHSDFDANHYETLIFSFFTSLLNMKILMPNICHNLFLVLFRKFVKYLWYKH